MLFLFEMSSGLCDIIDTKRSRWVTGGGGGDDGGGDSDVVMMLSLFAVVTTEVDAVG